MRDRKNESRAVFGKLTNTEKAKLVDLLKSKDIELVNGTEGLTAWSFTKNAEDHFLSLVQGGKAEIKTKFPKRYDKEGTPVTAKNIKDHKITDLLDTTEVAPVLKEKRDKEMTAELEKKLDSMTKKELGKEYGVSTDLKKDDMITEIIDRLFSEGAV